MPRNRIALIGGGQIGGTLAHLIRLEKSSATLCSRHRRRFCPRQDARHRAVRPDRRLRRQVQGHQFLRRHQGADVVIVTAGVPRKPGMSRDDLLGINPQGHERGRRRHQTYAPNAFVICITNRSTPWCGRCASSAACPTTRFGHGAWRAIRARSQHFCRKDQRLRRGRLAFRARLPWHTMCRAALLHRRRHSLDRAGQDGLDHSGAS